MASEKRISLFRQRAFGSLLAGSIASSIGSSAGFLAFTWLVYTETGSAFDVALLGIAGLVPRIAFGIFSGTFADRYSRLRLMIVADSFRAATMIALAASLFTFGFNLYIVLGSVFVLGLGQSLFRPAINSFLPTAVSKEDLGTANGIFTAAQEVTSVIGSPIGGILIGVLGAAAAFLFNGGSYAISGLLIVSVSLTLSHTKVTAKTSERRTFFQELKGGLEYVNRERALLKLTLASFGANFFLSLFFTFIVIYVAVQLIVDIHLLLGRRANTGYGDGAYEPPSGRLAERETLVEAAVRVAAAQMGIALDPVRVSLAHVLHDVSGAGRMAFFLTADGWADEACPLPAAGGTRSYSDFGWYPLTDLPATMIARARVAVRTSAAGARFSTYPAFGM